MAFTTFTTPDGQWEYGTGEYQKTIASYLGYNAPSSSILPSSLVDFFLPQMKAAQTIRYDTAKAIKIPTFYIWALRIDGTKLIAEWPFAKSLRDAAFTGFRIAMNDKFVTDAQRVALIKQLQNTAGSPSMTNLAQKVAVEKQMLIYDEVDHRVRHAAAQAAGTEAAGVFLVLSVAAAIALFIAFR
jgi:hypothetical protein